MANTFAPFGFRQYRGLASAPTYEQIVARVIYNAPAIYYGDPVQPDANGYVYALNSPTLQIAGVFAGCKYLSVSQKRTVWSNYWPGSDVASSNTVEAYIINDPNARFVVQAGGSTTPIGYADINANIGANLGTGNANTGISGAYIDQTTIATTSTLPFRIIGLVTDPPGSNGTDTASAYNYVIVGFNNISSKQLTGS